MTNWWWESARARVESGQTIAEWFAAYGPVVAAPYAEDEWPETIVCDRDHAITDAARAHWGSGRKAVPVHLCAHHLYELGKNALRADGVTAYGAPLQALE